MIRISMEEIRHGVRSAFCRYFDVDIPRVEVWLREPLEDDCESRATVTVIESIVGTSAILPSPNRICKNADDRDSVNHTRLHALNYPLYPV